MITATALEIVDVQELESLSIPGSSDIVKRAALLVEKRSKDELLYAALAMDWMLCEGLLEYYKAELKSEHEIDEIIQASLQKRIHLLMSVFNIENLDDMTNATWPEFIATYTLALIATAHFSLQGTHFDTEYQWDDYVEDYCHSPSLVAFRECSGLVIKAMEALVVAEDLRDLESRLSDLADIESRVSELADQAVCLRNKKAILERHKECNSIKSKFCDLREKKWPKFSDREAARRFSNELTDKEKETLGKHPVRTLTDALRTNRRKKLSEVS